MSSSAVLDKPAASGSKSSSEDTGKRRLVSVDALRGFDMFWIIGGAGLITNWPVAENSWFARIIHPQLEHVDWQGFRFYDLIFPLFLFVVGVSITLSIPKALSTHGKTGAITRIVRRTLLLYLLGIFYSGGIAKGIDQVRLLGVLQRIAICYGITATLFCFLKPKGLIAALLGVLVAYWAMMTFIPVPGLGAGHFEKGSNLANYIDSRWLPFKKYDGTWDPEGILSTIPAVGTCLLGVIAGIILQTKRIGEHRKALYLIGGGALLIGLGYLWGLQFPIIKKIWTSSYVLVAGGWSCILLGVFYMIIDVLKFQLWTRPFVWIGANAITIYIGASLIRFGNISERIVGGPVKDSFGRYGDWVISVVAMLIILATLRFMYHRKIFLRV